MKPYFTLALVLMGIFLTHAQVTTEMPKELTIGSKTYTGVSLTSTDPDGISIAHSGGVAKIPFEKLPPDLQTKFGFDPQKAADFRKQEAARQHALATRQAQEVAEAKADTAKKQELEKRIKNEAVEKYIEVVQVLPDGVLADPLESVNESSELTRLGGGGTAVFSYYPSGKTIFVKGLRGTAEGKRVRFTGIEDGTYTFVDTERARRTVEKWILVNRAKK